MRSFWTGLLSALILGAGGALAQPIVYHSPGDSGFRQAYAPYLPKQASVKLYLWLDPGPTAPSGTVCTNATGHASCAYDVRVQVQGDSQLVSFAPVSGPCDIGCKLTSSMLRMNAIPAQPLVGRTKLGELTVDTTYPLGGVIEVTGVHSVGAARQLETIPSLPIAYVPEPGMLILLVSGLAGLAALHRLRGGAR
jgi:hypothetical protein